MGVRGLTKYIAENSKLYLQPFELCDCYLVVDGNNTAFHLYKWVAKSHSAFGGDYDEYYEIVKDFFSMLKKCNVTPIVLFDGGYEKRKLKTVLSRKDSMLYILRPFARGFSKSKFCPLFTKQIFFDVMEDLNIICVQCDYEADVEIAAVARTLNCPVLSYDSDFYIFDVLYIPFSSVFIKPVKFDDSNKYYVRCSVYDVTHFLNEFDGLDKSMLPILATILGNDYISSSIFEKFFHHIILPKNKKKSFTQRKIHGVLHWLKKENLESATELILSHLKKKNAKKVLRAIKVGIRDYSRTSVSESVMVKLKSQIGNLSLEKNTTEIKLPSEIRQLYYKCRIHNFIINMITLGTYFTVQQVECVFQQSSHIPCLELISYIYTILTHYISHPKPLKIYLTLKNHYCAVQIKKNFPYCLRNFTLDDILKEPEDIRLNWMCSILGMDDDDMDIVQNSDWSIFILSVIYLIKRLNSIISLAHIHALVLMVIANKVIQKFVGYKNFSKFLKKKDHLIAKLKNDPISEGEGKNFKQMLDNVTLIEKLQIQNALIPFRQATEKGMGKAYCISTIHLFGCFQSCLYHIMQLNALLNYPLPHLKVNDFYSGTLLFNFYLSIKAKPEVDKFGCNLFKDAPNLRKVYLYLSGRLCEYSEKSAVVYTKKKKRNKKKASEKTEELCEDIVYYRVDENESEDSEEYSDENNPYAVLQNDAT